MDNLGAIAGPLLALALVSLFSVRTAILISVVPGLLAAAAIVYAIRQAELPTLRKRRKLPVHVRSVLQGLLGRLTAFEMGNVAATVLILRCTDLLTPGRGVERATQIALLLYTAYNVAAAVTSISRRLPVGPASQAWARAGCHIRYCGLRIRLPVVRNHRPKRCDPCDCICCRGESGSAAS